ncbi:MAG: DNA internalization-related competence protein ComEC/Rec2 [Chloroflexota bacterium]|jgi:competence protein ComEC
MAIIYVGIAWLVGLGLGAWLNSPAWFWLVFGIGSLVMALLLRHRPPVGLGLLVIGALCLGTARYSVTSRNIDDGQIDFYNGRDDVELVGVVRDEPQVNDRWQQIILDAEKIRSPDGEIQFIEGQVLVQTGRYPRIPYGARLQIQGRLEALFDNPEFNQQEYWARQGIYSQIVPTQVKILSEGNGSMVKNGIFSVKDRARQTIRSLLPDPEGALLTGILLGDDSGLPPALADQFRTTGLTHIIAISGFNIAILTGILLVVSKPFLGQKRSAWFVLLGITLYTILVGADAAVVRAAIMGALFVIAARLMGRPTFAPAGLFTAAILMTAINPFILWDIGFQLSFAATLGLMLYVGLASQWTEVRLQPSFGPDYARKATGLLAEVLFATLAATLVTLPIILYHFGQLSLISPLANLFVLPAQPGVMTWGGLATLTGMVVPAVGQLLAWVAWLFLAWTISLVRYFASFPAAAVPLSISPAGLVAIYGLLFGATWLVYQKPEKRGDLSGRLRQNLGWTTILFGAGIVAILATTWALNQPDGNLHVTFLDVGQGDATFIQTPSGRQILIDGGAYPTVLNEHLGRQIPFWDRDIDLIVATHPDADHVAGLPGVFDRYDVGRLITNGQQAQEATYQALLTAAAGTNTPVLACQAGEVIEIGDGVQLEVLNPTADGRSLTAGEHDNELSIAFRLIYGDFSLLLTGDAGEKTEQGMAAVGRSLAAVVYKAGHHGAKSSSSTDFLESVRPQVVIISAGEGNRYGHPHEEVLQRAGSVGAAVLRTDELGTIEVISDGQAMWWEAEVND